MVPRPEGDLTGRHVFGLSPHGTHFLFWRDGKVQAYDLNANTTRQLGGTAFQYYLYDQGRWGFSPWDQPDRYCNESALTWAPRAVAPFLIMHGTSDPTVTT